MQNEDLTALDATFLELEEADQSAHMHIGAVMVFEPPPGARPPTIDRVRADLGRSPRQPAAVSPAPLGAPDRRASLAALAG